jgi:putative photosynthetic complex assembly protein
MTAPYRIAANPEKERIPRLLLRAIGALLVFCLAMVAAARITGMDPIAAPPPSQPQEMRRIVMAPQEGGVVITDAETGQVVARLIEQGGGFVGGVHRALARVRDTHDAPALAPVHLVRWRDGRLSLLDPATGWRAELQGFGVDNHLAFAALLEGAPKGQSEGDVR